MKFTKSMLLLPVLLTCLFLGAIGAKLAYDRINSPAVYKPDGPVTYTLPVGKTSSPAQKVTPKRPEKKALLPGAKWVAQTFNNCGPATTSMVLQYFGHNVDQNQTKAALRTNADDKNVFTYEMADYLRTYGIESKLLYGGNIELLKTLVANGFYVVLEDWLHPNEDIGHVTIIRGYDDTQGILIADDSYIGVNITYPYEQFDKTQWKAFNREYLPLYKPGSEELLRAIVGDSWDQKIMFEKTKQTANKEIAQNSNDMYAWFNLGTSEFGLNNFENAKIAFEKSRSIGWPKRMLWYQIQPIQTYNALGEYQKAIELANIALIGNDSFAEAHLEKAIAYKQQGLVDMARSEVQTAIKYAPKWQKALHFLDQL